MNYLNLPCGSNFGGGIYAKYLAKKICELCEKTLIMQQFDAGDIGDGLDYHFLKSKLDHRQNEILTNRFPIKGEPSRR